MWRPESRQRFALVLIWLTPALWAINYIAARRAPGVVEPHMLALGRWAIAGALLAFMARAELWRDRRAIAAEWPQYLVLGTLGMLICGAWVYIGAKTTVAMNIALIYSASPVLIALGPLYAAVAAWGVLNEPMDWHHLVGAALILSGVFLVMRAAMSPAALKSR